MAKPSRSDVLALGLPAPAAASPAWLVERVDPAAGLLFYRAHGLSDGDGFSLRLTSSTTTGAQPGSLPAPLAEGVAYEAVPASADAFRVRLPGGAAITTFSTAGTGRFGILVDPWPALDAAIDEAWIFVQDALLAHGGEVDAGVIAGATKTLAGVLYIAKTCANDPAKADSYKPLTDLWSTLYAPIVERWRRGAPVRGAVDATPTTAELGALHRRIGSSASAESELV